MIIRRIIIFTSALLALVCTAAAAADVQGKPRLAICASGGDKAESIVALMEAELSKRDDLILLDRKHVNKVLAEHKMKIEGQLSSGDALKAGKALGCDVFCELRWYRDQTGKRESMLGDTAGFVAFDAATGIRIVDALLPANMPIEEAAVKGRDYVEEAARKQNGLATEQTQAVSVWAAHDVALPKRHTWVPDALSALLRRRLVNQPDIALLERASLGLLQRETAATGKPLTDLLLSSLCLDVDVSKTETEHGIRARMSVSDIAGEETHAVVAEGTATNLNGVVDTLVAGLSKMLDFVETAPRPEWYVLETRRLALSGSGLASIKAARAMAETAFALYPANRQTGPMLCSVLQREIEAPGATVDEQLDALHRTLDVLDLMDAHDVRNDRGKIHPIRRGVPMRQIWSRSRKKVFPLQTDDQQQSYDHVRKRALKRYLALPPLVGPDLGLLRAMAENDDQAVSLFLDLGVDTPRYDVQRLLGFEQLATGIKLIRHDHKAKCDVTRFSLKNKKKLLKLYETSRNRSDRIVDNVTQGDWRIGAAMAEAYLLQIMPELVPDPEARVRRLLRQAADLAIEDPTSARDITNKLLYREEDIYYGGKNREYRAIPPYPLRLPPASAVQEVKRMLNAFVAKRHIADKILLFLDWADSENANRPGRYIETAIAQLKDSSYVFPRYTRLKRLSKAESLTSIYKHRYGRAYVEKPTSAAGTPSLTPLRKIYDSSVLDKLLDVQVEWPSQAEGKTKTYPAMVLCAKIKDDALYLLVGRVLARGWPERHVRAPCALVKLDLISEEVSTLGRYSIAFTTKGSGLEGEHNCYRDNRFYLAEGSAYFKEQDGLVRIELDSGRTTRILKDGRLPIGTLSGLVGVNGQLYFAVNNYLARCNPDGSNLDILAAAHRAESESALDNTASRGGWRIHGIVRDRKGRRLIFPVKFTRGGNGMFAYNLDSNAITKLEARPVSFEGKDNIHKSYVWHGSIHMKPYQKDAFLLQGSDFRAHLFEPDKKTILLYVGGFWGFEYAVARTTRSKEPFRKGRGMSLLEKDGFVIHSDWDGLFQIVGPKSDGKATNPRWAAELPDKKAPVFLAEHGGNIVAVTRYGVWLLEFSSSPEVHDAEKQDKEAPVGSTGRLTVRSPVGGTLRLDDEAPYRFWPNRPLNWSHLPTGRHKVTFDWCGRKWTQVIHINEAERTDITVFPKAGIEKTMKLKLGRGVDIKLTWIPPGKGKMGDKAKGELADISIDDGFWMGIYEVTVEQFRTVMDLPRPDIFEGDRYPATSVSWEQAKEFCRRLTAQNSATLDGMVVRLPSEVEWEYACRAGTETLYYTGETRDSMATTQPDLRQPLFDGIKERRLEARCVAIGQRTPNLFGLHDMCSNVAEWCLNTRKEAPVYRFGLTGRLRYSDMRFETPPWYNGFRIVIAKPVP